MLKNYPKKIYFYLLIPIVFLGGFLRLYRIEENSLWIDEAFTLMQVEAVGRHGIPLLPSGQVDWKDPLIPHLSPLLSPIEMPGYSLRILSALFGIASIPIIYLLAKNLFNRSSGLISSFFLAFSYWHIAWSRQIRGYAPLVFFFILFLLTLTYHEKTRKKKYLYLGFVCLAFAIASKSFGVILLVPLLFYLIRKKFWLEFFLVSLASIWIAVQFQIFIPDFSKLGSINYFGYYFLGYFWQYFGILFSLFLIGLFLAFQTKKAPDIHWLILVIFLTSLFYFSFFYYVNQRRYLLWITPLFFLYSPLVFLYLSSKSLKKIAASIFLVLLIDYFSAQSLIFQPQVFYPLEEYTPQPNFNLGYKKLQEIAGKNDTVISPYPYLDWLYLKRSDFYIPISYTGLAEDKVNRTKEHYSGTNRLMDIDKLEQLLQKGDVYITLDEMALERISPIFKKYFEKKGEIIFSEITPQQLIIYRLAKEVHSFDSLNY